MTVMTAYQELEAQGLLYSKEKSEYFVSDHQIKHIANYFITQVDSFMDEITESSQ